MQYWVRVRLALLMILLAGIVLFASYPAMAESATPTPLPTSAAGDTITFSAGTTRVGEGYFTYAVVPGQIISDTLRVVNIGTTAGGGKVFAEDAETGSTSGVVYGGQTSPDCSQWIHLSQGHVDLKPGETALIPFTVNVPAQVRPGDHICGLAIKNDTLSTVPSGAVVITVQKITIVGVWLKASGNGSHLVTITNAVPSGRGGYQYMNLTINDTGDYFETMTGSVTIRDAQGNIVQTATATTDKWVPQTSTDYPVVLTNVLLPGRYMIHADFLYDHTHHAIYDSRFTVTNKDVSNVYTGVPQSQVPSTVKQLLTQSSIPPWAWVLIGLGSAMLLGLFFFILLFWKRRKNDDKKQNQETDQALLPDAK